jgi:hypothetical protein
LKGPLHGFALFALVFLVAQLGLGQDDVGSLAGKVSITMPNVQGYPGETWTVVDSPEQLGWSREKLKIAREYADSIHSAAVMIVQGGVVVDE